MMLLIVLHQAVFGFGSLIGHPASQNKVELLLKLMPMWDILVLVIAFKTNMNLSCGFFFLATGFELLNFLDSGDGDGAIYFFDGIGNI